MKVTPTLKAFVEELANRAVKESGCVVHQDAVDEYTSQIIEDDAAWMVRFAMDSNIKIPKQLSKFKDEASKLFECD